MAKIKHSFKRFLMVFRDFFMHFSPPSFQKEDLVPGSVATSPVPPTPYRRRDNGGAITESYAENFRRSGGDGSGGEITEVPPGRDSEVAKKDEEAEEGKFYSSLSRSQINTSSRLPENVSDNLCWSFSRDCF